MLQKLNRYSSITTIIGYLSIFIHKYADDALEALGGVGFSVYKRAALGGCVGMWGGFGFSMHKHTAEIGGELIWNLMNLETIHSPTLVMLKTYALRIDGKGIVCDWIEQ